MKFLNTYKHLTLFSWMYSPKSRFHSKTCCNSFLHWGKLQKIQVTQSYKSFQIFVFPSIKFLNFYSLQNVWVNLSLSETGWKATLSRRVQNSLPFYVISNAQKWPRIQFVMKSNSSTSVCCFFNRSIPWLNNNLKRALPCCASVLNSFTPERFLFMQRKFEKGNKIKFSEKLEQWSRNDPANLRRNALKFPSGIWSLILLLFKFKWTLNGFGVFILTWQIIL